MTARVAVSGLSVVVGVALVLTVLARGPAAAQPQRGEVRAWEYKVLVLTYGQGDPRDSEANLNRLGGEGWELCALHDGSRPAYCVFKRPKR